MSDELNIDTLNEKTLADLRKELIKRNLETSGPKTALVTRLKRYCIEKSKQKNSENKETIAKESIKQVSVVLERLDDSLTKSEVNEESNENNQTNVNDESKDNDKNKKDNDEKINFDSDEKNKTNNEGNAIKIDEHFEEEEDRINSNLLISEIDELLNESEIRENLENNEKDEDENDIALLEDKEFALELDKIDDVDNPFDESEETNKENKEENVHSDSVTENSQIDENEITDKNDENNTEIELNNDNLDYEKNKNKDDLEKTKNDSEDKKSTSNRSVWVSGLSSATRANDLKKHFSKEGKVVGAKVVSNSRSRNARCYGYVIMSTNKEADRCVKNLHHSKLLNRFISVQKAKPDTTNKNDDNKTLSKGKDEKNKIIEQKTEKVDDNKDAKSDKKDDKNDKKDAKHEKKDEKKDVKKEEKKDIKKEEKKEMKKDEKKDLKSDKKDEKSEKKDDKSDKKNDLNKKVSTSSKNVSKSKTSGEHNDPKRRSTKSRSRERRRLSAERRRREESRRRLEERRRRQERLREEKEREKAERRLQELRREQRLAAEKLERERQALRLERERIQQEKLELLRFEKEQLEKEREELKRQKLKIESVQRLERVDSTRSNDRGVPRNDDRKRSRRESPVRRREQTPPSKLAKKAAEYKAKFGDSSKHKRSPISVSKSTHHHHHHRDPSPKYSARDDYKANDFQSSRHHGSTYDDDFKKHSNFNDSSNFPSFKQPPPAPLINDSDHFNILPMSRLRDDMPSASGRFRDDYINTNIRSNTSGGGSFTSTPQPPRIDKVGDRFSSNNIDRMGRGNLMNDDMDLDRRRRFDQFKLEEKTPINSSGSRHNMNLGSFNHVSHPNWSRSGGGPTNGPNLSGNNLSWSKSSMDTDQSHPSNLWESSSTSLRYFDMGSGPRGMGSSGGYGGRR